MTGVTRNSSSDKMTRKKEQAWMEAEAVKTKNQAVVKRVKRRKEKLRMSLKMES